MSELNFTGEYVDKITVNMPGRSFQVFGSDGSCQTNSSGTAGTATLQAVGKSGRATNEKQVLYAGDGSIKDVIQSAIDYTKRIQDNICKKINY